MEAHNKGLEVIQDPNSKNNNTSHLHDALQLTKYLQTAVLLDAEIHSEAAGCHSHPTEQKTEAQRG